MSARMRYLCLCSLFTVCVGTMSAFAGAIWDVANITDKRPAPRPGHLAAQNVGRQWDERCMPVAFRVNDTLDPIPNPLGRDFLTLAQATQALRQALETWNAIPTSFIEMRIVGTTSNPGLRGFDMINEITFRTDMPPTLYAQAVPTALIQHMIFADGDDLDGDGDGDVASAITVCQDVDGDGDIEFPAGFYKAGTLLDCDVEFNADVVRFTIDPQDVDSDSESVDLIAGAVHEFGHAHGLAHSLINQHSRRSGKQAAMYPILATQDPDNELAGRALTTDDSVWSSVVYPEGFASSGPGALQPGDRAFYEAFGVITGKVLHGRLRQPVAGASVFAVDIDSGAVVASTISGHTQCAFDPVAGLCTSFVDPTFSVLHGNYILTVPAGTYKIAVEAVDGAPVSAHNVNNTTQIGALLGQQDFPEEFYNGESEGAFEAYPQQATPIVVVPGAVVTDVNFVTNRTRAIANFGAHDFTTRSVENLTGVLTPPGRFYAVAIPAAQMARIRPDQELLLQNAEFFTFSSDTSVPPAFAQALLTTGVIHTDGTATLDLHTPLARKQPFVGQDQDFASWYFENPHQLGRLVRDGFARGEIDYVFLVLQVPTATPFPGPRRLAPAVVVDGFIEGRWEDNDATPPLGLSFISEDNGATFLPVARFIAQKYQLRGDFNIMFALRLSVPPRAR